MIEKLKRPDETRRKEAEQFIKENNNFFDIVYSTGAETGPFGLVNRYIYRKFPPKRPGEKAYISQVWGFPGFHYGEDLGYCPKLVSPFDFVKVEGKSYTGLWGYNVFLHHVLGFRMMISHMYPKEIKIMDIIKNKYSLSRGAVIGPPGSNGNSTGRHSHTEIQIPSENEILDYIIYIRHGEQTLQGYTDDQIIDISRNKCKKVNEEEWSDKDILNHYKKICKKGKILFVNDFKIIRKKKYSVWGKYTLYNPKALFNI